jgi:hypothetical protein
MYINPNTMKEYKGGNILESTPVFYIPTDEDELASLIYTYSCDWAETLYFFEQLAKARHIILDTVSISEKIRQLIGEE